MQRHLVKWEASSFPWSSSALKLLQSISSSQSFRPCQQAAINIAQSGYSLFLQLPTGAGKSVCFQLPALLDKNKTTLVVTPLRSLLNDQKQNLVRVGLSDRALFLTPGDVPQSIPDHTALIYATPEMILQNPSAATLVKSLVDSNRLSRIVLDEAHCVVEWGNTFRPSYLDFARYSKTHLPHIPVTFLTATAVPELVTSTASLFGRSLQPLPDPAHPLPASAPTTLVAVQQMLDRPNLRLQVLPKTSSVIAVMAAMLRSKEPAIVYVLSQKDAESVAKSLAAFGIDAQPYHAGMSDAARKRAQYLWMSGKSSVICATVAFGMGIDRADVRHVIHHSIPLSLSGYMQQIGRAGRDGQPSVCTLFYAPGDRRRAEFIGSGGDDFVDASTFRGIRDVIDLVTSTGCRREILHGHFGYPLDECCRNCNCGDAILIEEDDSKLQVEAPRQTRRGWKSNLDVEILYQTLQQQAKKQSGPLRRDDIVSRKTIETILAHPPASKVELAAIRGVGQAKAEASFDILMAHLRRKSKQR
ncbi:hypothetical protein LEN26_019746 [Aphanomyces euteiches]|nr:hypothetical protein LEN26_019746 [Aphanomyces euteiches]